MWPSRFLQCEPHPTLFKNSSGPRFPLQKKERISWGTQNPPPPVCGCLSFLHPLQWFVSPIPHPMVLLLSTCPFSSHAGSCLWRFAHSWIPQNQNSRFALGSVLFKEIGLGDNIGKFPDPHFLGVGFHHIWVQDRLDLLGVAGVLDPVLTSTGRMLLVGWRPSLVSSHSLTSSTSSRSEIRPKAPSVSKPML